jgi:hypothetical protein
MTANLDKWPAFHSTGEDHPPCFVSPMSLGQMSRQGSPASSTTAINLMAVAPMAGGQHFIENEGSSVVVMLERPIYGASCSRCLRIFDFDPDFRWP